jgi:hypothetical protein
VKIGPTVHSASAGDRSRDTAGNVVFEVVENGRTPIYAPAFATVGTSRSPTFTSSPVFGQSNVSGFAHPVGSGYEYKTVGPAARGGARGRSGKVARSDQ